MFADNADSPSANLELALAEYMAKHANTENPIDALYALGDQGLLDLLNEAGGREIAFEDTNNPDQINWYFK